MKKNKTKQNKKTQKQEQKQKQHKTKKQKQKKKMCRFCLIILEHTNLGKRNTVCYNFLLKWKKKYTSFHPV